jgi:hypothetical protein
VKPIEAIISGLTIAVKAEGKSSILGPFIALVLLAKMHSNIMIVFTLSIKS